MEMRHQQDRQGSAPGRPGPPSRPHEARHDRGFHLRPKRLAGDRAIGSAKACLAALENPLVAVAPSAMARVASRFGHIGAVREALLARPDLPLVLRLSLVRQLSGALAGFAAGRGWLDRGRAEQAGREACEQAAVTIAALHPDQDIRPLVRHLRASGELTVELTLRALLSGDLAMFESALAERAGSPLRRVRALVRSDSGLRAVFDRAGLPASACMALRDVLAEAGRMRGNEEPASGRLNQRLIQRALVNVMCGGIGDRDPLFILLRRFAAEAACATPAMSGGVSWRAGFRPGRREPLGKTAPAIGSSNRP